MSEDRIPNVPEVDEEEEKEERTDQQGMDNRLERLGGEPAPDISPEEFARLQAEGQLVIDSRGRVRSARRAKDGSGVTLQKRRAWYR